MRGWAVSRCRTQPAPAGFRQLCRGVAITSLCWAPGRDRARLTRFPPCALLAPPSLGAPRAGGRQPLLPAGQGLPSQTEISATGSPGRLHGGFYRATAAATGSPQHPPVPRRLRRNLPRGHEQGGGGRTTPGAGSGREAPCAPSAQGGTFTTTSERQIPGKESAIVIKCHIYCYITVIYRTVLQIYFKKVRII